LFDGRKVQEASLKEVCRECEKVPDLMSEKEENEVWHGGKVAVR
jgi:hypothetical protein